MNELDPDLSVIEITAFPTWLEKKLLIAYEYDLSSITAELGSLRTSFVQFLSQSSSIRSASGILPNTQSNRIFKICDQIDSLADTIKSMNQPSCSLPDSDWLKEFSQKVKNKLKVIDEMAASTKLTKTSGLEVG